MWAGFWLSPSLPGDLWLLAALGFGFTLTKLWFFIWGESALVSLEILWKDGREREHER